MKSGKIVFGLILLLVAIYLAFLMDTESMGAKFIGGGILAILGIGSIIAAFVGKKEAPKSEEPQAPASQEATAAPEVPEVPKEESSEPKEE